MLVAVVEAEGIEISDDEVVEALQEASSEPAAKPQKLLDRLRSEGRLDALKQDLAARKALDLLVEQAKPIDAGRAEAREKLWTPGS